MTTRAHSLPARLGAALDDRPRLRFALAVASVVWFLVQLGILIQQGQLPWPGGDVTNIFDPAGDALRDGTPVYTHAFNGAFFYSPPIAVLYGATSWLPTEVQQGFVLIAEIAALRYLGGSWFGFCLALAFPVMPWELMSGHFNLVIAAGIVMAVQGKPRLACATAFAKISPILAVDPRDWRSMVPVIVIGVLITLPWLALWPAWLGLLVEAYGKAGIGPQIPVPYVARAAIALALLALWRPWSRAAAAVVAIPAFYYASFVLFVAPTAVVLRGLSAPPGRDHPVCAALRLLKVVRPGS